MKHNLKKLIIWNDAVDLAIDIYKVTELFPKEEKFGLVSQMNRSAVSIPSNIAEGAGRNHKGDFLHYLGIANGSANELFTHLTITNRLEYFDNDLVEKVED